MPMNSDDEDLLRLSQLAEESAKWDRLTHHMRRIRESGEHTDAQVAAITERMNRMDERSASRDEKLKGLEQQMIAMRTEVNEELRCLTTTLQQSVTNQAVTIERVDQSIKLVHACMERHGPMEEKVRQIEIVMPANKKTTEMLDKLMWLGICAVLSFIAYKVGLTQ